MRRAHTILLEEILVSGLFPGDKALDDLRARRAEGFDDAMGIVQAVSAEWRLCQESDEGWWWCGQPRSDNVTVLAVA